MKKVTRALFLNLTPDKAEIHLNDLPPTQWEDLTFQSLLSDLQFDSKEKGREVGIQQNLGEAPPQKQHLCQEPRTRLF